MRALRATAERGSLSRMIWVSIREQRLWQRLGGVWRSWPVSTAVRGPGNRRDSLQTPLGEHRIAARIGEGLPALTAFVARRPVGLYRPGRDDPERDWILGRILWLEGMQTGLNRRGAVDTKSRFIYIHGTHEESRIGRPASHGCIRMRIVDMLELFDHSRVGERVRIYEHGPGR